MQSAIQESGICAHAKSDDWEKAKERVRALTPNFERLKTRTQWLALTRTHPKSFLQAMRVLPLVSVRMCVCGFPVNGVCRCDRYDLSGPSYKAPCEKLNQIWSALLQHISARLFNFETNLKPFYVWPSSALWCNFVLIIDNSSIFDPTEPLCHVSLWWNASWSCGKPYLGWSWEFAFGAGFTHALTEKAERANPPRAHRIGISPRTETWLLHVRAFILKKLRCDVSEVVCSFNESGHLAKGSLQFTKKVLFND